MVDKFSSKMHTSFFKYLSRRLVLFIRRLILSTQKQTTQLQAEPVFIVGCGHSGTSLMNTILSRHSSIFAVGHETGMMMPSTSPYCSQRYFLSLAKIAAQLGASKFVEKTPKHVHMIDEIFKLFPESQIILMVREPRDTVLSLNKRLKNLKSATLRWKVDNTELFKWTDHERAFLCYYEDLVKRPDFTVKNICNFLSLDFEEEMIKSTNSPYKTSSGLRKERIQQVSQPITDNTQKYLSQMEQKDQLYVLSQCDSLMVAFGYNKEI